MKLLILATLIAAAAAFAPISQKAATTTSLAMAFEDALGAQPPFGFFDPLNLVSDGDQANFDRLRYVEIKHGRICMLAVVGYLVTEAGIRLPGDINLSGTKFADIPGGFDALSAITLAGFFQIFFFVGALELFVMKDITGGDFPGDFRNGAIDFGWNTFSEQAKLRKRAIELNQGRAAQMGILALMVHEKLGVSIIPSIEL
jgi:Chlorophyll A-B binding protein